MRALAVAFGVSCAMAAAMPAVADDLAGEWLFETSEFSGDCKITGVMTFTPNKLSNSYSCHFRSEQICGPKYYHMYIKVDQTCTAQKVGKQVAVKSQVKEVLQFKADYPFDTDYLADNFVVALQKNLSEMLGDHYDEQRQLKARFWREEELIS